MFTIDPSITYASKAVMYADLQRQLQSLLNGERDFIANTANCAALIYQMVPDLNWAGFYFLREIGNGKQELTELAELAELVLGPFQGKPACVRIPVAPVARGVCGAAAATRTTQRIENVHDFPGHIACDGASLSELVVPLIVAGKVIGVLDLDSPKLARFDAEDQAGFEAMAAILLAASSI
jgi:L-methionine (R)-S-oxide reductase